MRVKDRTCASTLPPAPASILLETQSERKDFYFRVCFICSFLISLQGQPGQKARAKERDLKTAESRDGLQPRLPKRMGTPNPKSATEKPSRAGLEPQGLWEGLEGGYAGEMGTGQLTVLRCQSPCHVPTAPLGDLSSLLVRLWRAEQMLGEAAPPGSEAPSEGTRRIHGHPPRFSHDGSRTLGFQPPGARLLESGNLNQCRN